MSRGRGESARYRSPRPEKASRKGAKLAKKRCGLLLQVVDDALDPVPQQLDVEVDEESESEVGETEMGQELLRVHRSDALDRFQLNDHLGFNDEVGVVHGPVQTQFGCHLIEVTNRSE